MKIRWPKDNSSRLSLPEMLWRTRRALLTRWDSLFARPRNLAPQARKARKSLPPLSHAWPVSYFQTRTNWTGDPIYWQDPVGMNDFSRYHWSHIDYHDTNRFGDYRTTWELNRHQFLRKWALDDTRPLPDRVTAVTHLLLHWIESNPAYQGINWCDSREIAHRIMSWEAVIEILGDENFHPAAFRVIQRSIHQHALHLQRYPTLYPSGNHHRISELVGEMACAAAIPSEKALLQRAWNSWQLLEQEALQRVYTDGASRTGSVYFHTYDLLYLSKAECYAIELDFPVPLEIRTLRDKMQQFVNGLTDTNGAWFDIGDRNNGDLQALLPWITSPPPVSSPLPPGNYSYEQSGYYIFKQPPFHVVFKTAPQDSNSQSHADMLSVLLKIDDLEILSDSGSCSPYDSEKWQHYFRSPYAHNVVIIDSATATRRIYPPVAQIAACSNQATAQAYTASATLEYQLNGQTVQHTRQVLFHPDSPRFLIVKDRIHATSSLGQEIHGELIWNFGPSVSDLTALNDPSGTHHMFNLTTQSNIPVRFTIETNTSSSSAIYFGSEDLPAGYCSDKFGERTPTFQLRCSTAGTEINFTTTFTRETATQ